MSETLPDVVRQAELRRYAALEPGDEEAFEQFCELATIVCEAPVALISFLNGDRELVTAQIGWAAAEIGRGDSFCAEAIAQPEGLFVEDARQDPAFAASALVTGPPRVRFYAGIPLVTPDGVPVGALSVIDRVPRTLLREQIESLRALARHAMARLVQRHDRRALEELGKQVERMKDEFLSVVNHELRTPLTSIYGALDLLRGGAMGQLPERGEKLLEIARRNAERLVRVVNHAFTIFDLARAESGSLVLEREACDAAALLAESADAIQELANEAGVVLALAPVPAPLWADPYCLGQVLIHLLGEAVRGSPPGATIWVTAERDAAELAIHILDQQPGAGRPGRALVPRQDGLAWSICRGIVEQHGGQLSPAAGEDTDGICIKLPLAAGGEK